MRSVGFAALLIIATGSLRAQAPFPNPVLASIFPGGGQAGATVEVTVAGTDLDGASRLNFSVPGVESKPKMNAQNKPEPNKFVVTIPANAATGTCEARVVGRYGISTPRGFAIGKTPEAIVPDTHTGADRAFKADAETTLNGRAVKNAATFITFAAKKGRRIFAVCRPAEIDSRMDAVMTLSDAGGRVLELLKPDGVLDITPQADGPVTLKLHDLTFRGGEDFPWRVVITSTPVVEHVFSDGTSAVLYGRNLPGATAEKSLTKFGKPLEKLVLPADKAGALIASSPLAPKRFAPLNDAGDADVLKPVALKPPCVYTGWFPAKGRPRTFTFDAKKGDVFWLEVACASKGLPADPFLIVEKLGKPVDGKETWTSVGEAFDTTAVATGDEFIEETRDPAFRFESKEDGTYRIQIRDSFCNSAGAPRHPFELSMQPSGTGFSLVTLPIALPKAKGARTADFGIAPLWRGGVSVMKVYALRKRGFTGPVTLSAEGLPQGVTCLGGLIEEGRASGYIAFQADDGAKDWAGLVRVHGTANGVGETSTGGATLLWKVADSQKEPVLSRRSQDVALGVVGADPAPFAVGPANAAATELPLNGKATVDLTVRRGEGFTEAFKLHILGSGTADAPIEMEVPAGAKAAKLEVDAAKLKLGAGEHQLVLRGTAKFKHRRGDDPKAAPKDTTFVVFSKPVSVLVKAPEKKETAKK